MRNVIYIGIQSSVLALAADSGQEIWRTRLRGGSFVGLAKLGERLYASCQGELFCLDPATGTVLWHNKLKGLGQGFVTIAGDGGGNATLAAAQAAEQAQQAAIVAAVVATSAATSAASGG